MNLWKKKNRRLVHSEEWFAELYGKLPIAAPEGPHVGDPGDVFLRQLAQRSGKPPLSDPRVKHVAGCSYCLHRLREIQSEAPKKRQILSSGMLVAFATVALVVAVFISFKVHHATSRGEQLSAVQTLDLSEMGTTRGGEANQVPVFHLPQKQDQLTLILPDFSPEGSYRVQVLAGKKQPEAVAEANGNATRTGRTTVLKVLLDLSKAKSGLYYLATTHGSDEAAYYYPIQVAK